MDKIQRFWTKVQRCEHGETCPDCCWLWTGAQTRGGYGNLTIQHDGHPKMMRANRMAWVLTFGAIPGGLNVLHNCPEGDNRLCVNPQHLWLGTHKENTHDALRKGRLHVGDRHPLRRNPAAAARGARQGNALLTDEQVLDIRYLASHGMSQRLLGHMYGVHSSTIGQITRGNHWTHLPRIVEVR